jgi:hypothetical protein
LVDSRRRVTLLGALAALAASLSIAASALGATFGPTLVVRTAPAGVPLKVGDIAGHERLLGVVWSETAAGVSRTYLRWSPNGGGGFRPRKAMNAGRRASAPQIATCSGTLYVVTEASGPVRVVLDRVTQFPDKFRGDSTGPVAAGRGGDVACGATSGTYGLVAVAWFDTSTSPAHVKLRIEHEVVDVCEDPCITVRRFDLGPGTPRNGLSLAATRNGFAVAWTHGSAMRYKRYRAHNDFALTTSAFPTRTLTSANGGSLPELASAGDRVVLAYADAGDTRLLVSGNLGGTFGSPTVVVNAPCTACEAGSVPMSADVLGPWILVEALLFGPAGDRSRGYLSDDGGDSWSRTPLHDGAAMVGGLFRPDGLLSIAEAWDDSRRDPAPARERLRLHVGQP